MQLIMASDYAIRALLYLAIVNRMAPASEISEKMNIPRQYLVTMSRKLKDAGLIDAVYGQNGGYFLARPADGITLLDIVSVTEGTTKLNRCLEHSQYCSRFATDACPVRATYVELQNVVEDMLRGVTLGTLKGRLDGKRPA